MQATTLVALALAAAPALSLDCLPVAANGLRCRAVFFAAKAVHDVESQA